MNFRVAELLQLHAHSGRTGRLSVQGPEIRANIYLSEGLLAHVECGGLVGERALMAILSWDEAPFEWYADEIPSQFSVSRDVEEVLVGLPFQPPLTPEEVAMSAQAPAVDPASGPSGRFGFVVCGPEFDPFRFEMEIPTVIIGREPSECHVVIPDPSVSGKHGMLMDARTHVIYRDLGSTNGSRVNGELVDTCSLYDGDVLCVGQVALEVRDFKPLVKVTPDPRQRVKSDTVPLEKLSQLPTHTVNRVDPGLMPVSGARRKKQTCQIELPSNWARLEQKAGLAALRSRQVGS